MFDMGNNNRLILASASPRRLDLLRTAGIEPLVCPTECEEICDGMAPRDLVVANARLKAEACAKEHSGVIVAADTVVALDDKIFGKPQDAADAERMLAALSGRTHSVFTGVAVVKNGEVQVDAAETKVTFRELTHDEIAAYVASGEPLDKAGAYAIQGGAGAFVAEVDGDFDNIVGLPLYLLNQMVDLFDFIEF